MPSSSKGPTRAASKSFRPQGPEAPEALERPTTPQSRVPRERRVKQANGRHLAFVEIGGRRTSLGAWNSAESRQALVASGSSTVFNARPGPGGTLVSGGSIFGGQVTSTCRLTSRRSHGMNCQAAH